MNVLSVLSFISMPQLATYSASKAAAWSLTNGLRVELRHQGTLVVAVHAGFIDTDMAAGVDAEKVSPQSVAAQIVTAIEADAEEVLADADQRDGQGGPRQRPDDVVPGPAGTMGRRPSGQPMSSLAWKDVPTRTADIGGVPFAYRELGADSGVPVVFLHHFTAVLDDWDPRVIDGMAAEHRVIAFDNRGVGASGGSVRRPSRRWVATPSRSFGRWALKRSISSGSLWGEAWHR